jgi:hypothetical protein
MSNNLNEKPKQPVQQPTTPKPETKPKPIGIRMETFSDQSTYDKKGKKSN